MIKGLKIVLLGSVLACATASTMYACISESVQEPAIVAYAEETFQEKSYVYSREDGVATLILLNDVDCSIRLQIFSEEFDETIYATYTRDVNVVTIYLPEGELIVEVNDETMTFGEYLPPEEPNVFENIWGEFEVWKETYLVPLLSGVSITSILSMIVTIIFTVIKNKKLDQKVLTITERANEKYQQAEEKLVEVKEILGEVHEIHQLTLNNEKVNSETKTFLEEKVKYMVTVVDENSEKVNKIDDLVKVLTLLTQLQVKISKQSAEIVKSGIIEDINEIAQLVKKL